MDAAWHPDPGGRHELRYWDGSAWTDHVSDNGVTGIDPLPPLPGAGGGNHGGQAEAHTDLSTEPTRFSPAGADPAPVYGGGPAQSEAAPAEAAQPWQPWDAEPAAEPAAAEVESHEAATVPPAEEPPAEVSPYSRPSALDDPAHETEPEPEPAPEPVMATEPEPTSEPSDGSWIDGVLLPGERAVRTVSTTARDVTVTTQRVVVREDSGSWTAIRLDRVSHAEVRESGEGTVVGIFITGGPSRSVTLTDASQAVALVNALTA
jgi:hypothetical protein